jgi:hypothetical protein
MRQRLLSAGLTVLLLGFAAADSPGLAVSADGSPETARGEAIGEGRVLPEAGPGRRIPAEAGMARAEPNSVFAPDSALPQAPTTEKSAPAVGLPGRTSLTQPGCTICLEGAGGVQWVGTSGSYYVDGIGNFRSGGTSGTLDLRIALSSTLPVFGQTISYYTFTDIKQFSPLAAGFHYTNVNSGTVGFYPSLIPAGQYYMFLYLREFQGGSTYAYTDFMLMNNRVSCNGASCSTVATCTEDAYTMCLVNGRYRVTSHWRNQYAGGATANLSKAKLTDTMGAFWIADANTYEYLIRFNTATNNGRIWIAIPTFTDVEFWVAVTDTVGGQSKEYHSLPGNQSLIYDPFYFVYP